MKSLSAIALIQVVVFAMIFIRLSDLDNKIELMAAETAGQDSEDVVDYDQIYSTASRFDACSDEEALRSIIREELTASLAASQGHVDTTPTAVGPQPQVDFAEMERRRDMISQQLDYYVSIGRITEVEMARLQSDIAKLDPTSRREALGKLTRALNSGSLEGRL